MINWFDMPAEGLSNGGLFEVKELEVTENGTYETKGEMYNKVTVNVEGGGGDSDFSTAEVVLTNNSGNPFEAYGATFYNEEEYKSSTGSIYESGVSGTIPVILYKGKAFIDLVTSINKSAVVLSGDITGVNDVLEQTKYKGFYITGDCTITIS